MINGLERGRQVIYHYMIVSEETVGKVEGGK